MCVSINFKYFVVKMSFWTFVMYQVKSSENLEGMSPGGLINHGKKKPSIADSLYKLGRQSFLEPHQ